MKMNFITVLLILFSITACNSTSESKKTEVAKNDVTPAATTIDENKGGLEAKQQTNKELAKIAKNANFTKAELRAAAKELGFRCTMVERTGSHLKKKICNTREQREVLARASQNMLRNYQLNSRDRAKPPSDSGGK